MARSLTVKHDETASSSSLLTAFLLFALAWMALAVFTSEPAGAVPPGGQEINQQ